MLRPESYQHPQVVLQDVPYESAEEFSKESRTNGSLCRGDIVWTQEPEPNKKIGRATIGFVDKIGLVSLNPELLIRADVLNERERKNHRV